MNRDDAPGDGERVSSQLRERRATSNCQARPSDAHSACSCESLYKLIIRNKELLLKGNLESGSITLSLRIHISTRESSAGVGIKRNVTNGDPANLSS